MTYAWSALNQLENHLAKMADPRAKNYYFLKSVYQPLWLFFIYLATIYVIMPAWMRNRKPYDLKRVMIVYNSAQIVLNALLFSLISLEMIQQKPNFFCSEVDLANNRVMNYHYYYFLLKLLDLGETLIYVLRKNSRQVSLLHVFHHSSMIFSTWTTCAYHPGGQGQFLGFANTFVHAVMYFYYLYTSMNPEAKAYVNWKKYLTQLQIAHQVFIFVSFAMPLVHGNCRYPKSMCMVYMLQVGLLIVLFTQFYNKTYIQKKDKSHLKTH